MTTLTADRFDKLIPPNARARPNVISGAKAIGARIGVSEDFVRETLIGVEGCPVRRIGRRYFVVEDDLIEFVRNLPVTAR